MSFIILRTIVKRLIKWRVYKKGSDYIKNVNDLLLFQKDKLKKDLVLKPRT